MNFYKVLQHLSLDISIGAVILLHFFSSYYSVDVQWPVYLLLALAVWIIYTVDHLRDAVKADRSNRARYIFHRQYERVLKWGVLLTLIACGILIFFLEKQLIINGLSLAGLCAFYLIFQSWFSKYGLKELYVAIVYSVGILLAPMTLSQSVLIYPTIVLILLSYLNLIIFSWFEENQDAKDNFSSIATTLGMSSLEKLIIALISLGLAITITSIAEWSLVAVYTFLVLTAFLLLIKNRNWALQNGRYRTIGDGVFLVPILFSLL